MARIYKKLTQAHPYDKLVPNRLASISLRAALNVSALKNMTLPFQWENIPFAGRPRDFYGRIYDVFIDLDYAFLDPLLQDGPSAPLIIDAGSNVGSFALYCLSVRDDLIIHSIEPSPGTYALMAKNAQPHPNWQAHHFALWHADTAVEFDTSEHASAGHHIRDLRPGTEGETHTVDAKRLVTFLSEIDAGEIEVLKMDIEGAEGVVLTDKPELLDKVKHMVIEIHPDVVDKEAVLGLLREHFSHVEILMEEGTQYTIAHAY
jgi:FkbM family methyltransferase